MQRQSWLFAKDSISCLANSWVIESAQVEDYVFAHTIGSSHRSQSDILHKLLLHSSQPWMHEASGQEV